MDKVFVNGFYYQVSVHGRVQSLTAAAQRGTIVSAITAITMGSSETRYTLQNLTDQVIWIDGRIQPGSSAQAEQMRRIHKVIQGRPQGNEESESSSGRTYFAAKVRRAGSSFDIVEAPASGSGNAGPSSPVQEDQVADMEKDIKERVGRIINPQAKKENVGRLGMFAALAQSIVFHQKIPSLREGAGEFLKSMADDKLKKILRPWVFWCRPVKRAVSQYGKESKEVDLKVCEELLGGKIAVFAPGQAFPPPRQYAAYLIHYPGPEPRWNWVRVLPERIKRDPKKLLAVTQRLHAGEGVQ